MTSDDLETVIQDALPRLNRLGALVRFDLGKDGLYTVDARGPKAVLAGDDDDGDCTIKISAENLVKLLGGDMDPMVGYALGRIKVSGSLDVAMKLVRAIG